MGKYQITFNSMTMAVVRSALNLYEEHVRESYAMDSWSKAERAAALVEIDEARKALNHGRLVD
jgi:hypothetical protein